MLWISKPIDMSWHLTIITFKVFPFPFPFFQIVSLIPYLNDMEQIQTIYFKGKKKATLWQLYKQKGIPSLSHLCLGFRIYHAKTQALGQMKSPSERKLCKNIKELIGDYNWKPTSPLQPLSVFWCFPPMLSSLLS